LSETDGLSLAVHNGLMGCGAVRLLHAATFRD